MKAATHSNAAFICRTLTLLFVGVTVNVKVSIAGVTSTYIRRFEASRDMPINSPYFYVPPDHNAPQQVHLTQGDYDGRAVIVSWITPAPAPSMVKYGLMKGLYDQIAVGSFVQYKYYKYTSGYIHHVKLEKLEFDRTYYYQLGDGDSARSFSFISPPKVSPDSSYTFGVIGDLGQTYDSLSTLQHYLKSPGQTLLYVGDLSYADHYLYCNNIRWDTWSRLVESSTAYQPWIWTAGNHEIEYSPSIGETSLFKSFLHRFPTPYLESGSPSPLFYSIRRASAHIIVLSSYSAYSKYSLQNDWFQAELANVDRSKTPWLIVLMHCPLYNSNNYHYMEGETFRVVYEPLFVQAKVDVVFAGHVHAYERTHQISNVRYNVVNKDCTPVIDNSAPVYINVGDGGNVEGIAADFTYPQPEYSAYREASFGHAILEIKNQTHAYYYWHRNQDGKAVVGDSYWLLNQIYKH